MSEANGRELLRLDHVIRNELAARNIVQKVDSTIQLINLYPLDKAIGFRNAYPPESDLYTGIALSNF